MRFPVIETEIESGIYHPLPYYGDQNDWRNKNRIFRSRQEIDKFCEEMLGSSKIEPCGNLIMGILFDPKNQTIVGNKNLKDVDDTMFHHWTIMQIIKIGPSAFNTMHFPTGAPASIGDFVQVEPSDAQMNRFKESVIITCPDSHIRVLIENPIDAINS